VVIGIIAVLVGILMPVLSKARMQSEATVCKANLYQMGQAIQIYANNNVGWMFPVGPLNPARPADNQYESLGTNAFPWERWPAVMFEVAEPVPTGTYVLPDGASISIPPGDSFTGSNPAFIGATNASHPTWSRPWKPKVMKCPSDDPSAEHSYLVNKHLTKSPQELLKITGRSQSKTSDQIVVMGEKVSSRPDYYMEPYGDDSEFGTVVEHNRHGIKYGSNYLYKDWSVRNEAPEAAMHMLDPWDLSEGT
jgi:hypothetical protein